ncbi:MAG TPA: HAD family hydrolase [Candidatus Paceibacterota bacterium]|nr:HAD family hydrolase [Candidatus Paceibacterota bacterium]
MDVWVFDNDGTLYDDREAYDQFLVLVGEYLRRKGFDVTNSREAIQMAKARTGMRSSALALRQVYDLPYDELVNETFMRIKLEECKYLRADPKRASALSALSAPAVVFTNNPSVFAERVLSAVKLLEHFSDVFGIERTDFSAKPSDQAFRSVETRFPLGTRFILVDDTPANLHAAKARGWRTLLFDPQGNHADNQAHSVLRSFSELASHT